MIGYLSLLLPQQKEQQEQRGIDREGSVNEDNDEQAEQYLDQEEDGFEFRVQHGFGGLRGRGRGGIRMSSRMFGQRYNASILDAFMNQFEDGNGFVDDVDNIAHSDDDDDDGSIKKKATIT
ncbi:MAG: hypothetical protein EZS28_000668 [Streblomastix strix]|uniref:Uncharacterized protein n=1 Tax=Streblomastix strix TaxID=222440 RepID=A0A5J4XAH6_9EUKA|nr:MAG: hypothetical protein EZS28_000668 [Streblomastix strix]